MKPRFELWDTDTANLLGSYESIPDVLSDLNKAFPTAEAKLHIKDLVLTLELGGDDDDTMILLAGPDLYRLTRPLPACEAIAS